MTNTQLFLVTGPFVLTVILTTLDMKRRARRIIDKLDRINEKLCAEIREIQNECKTLRS